MTSKGTPSAPSISHATSDTTTATSSRYTSGSWNCASSFRHLGTGASASSWLGP